MLSKTLTESTISHYSAAILETSGKKNCTNMKNETGKSHDILNRMLDQNPEESRKNSKKRAFELFGKKSVSLIIDDTTISKEHSKLIEGVDYVWDSSSGRPVMGLCMETFLLTDGAINLPIDCRPYFSKQIAGSNAPTKVEIALSAITEWIIVLDIKMVIADAHYSTKWLIKKLANLEVPYCMKITSTKVVEIGGKRGQLRAIFRPVKNNKTGQAKGFFNGIPCFFYFVKYDGKILYFISSQFMKKTQIAAIYKLRWKIEMFHRTAKQLLGLKDCQALSPQKQLQHAFYVIEAYVYAELKRIKGKFENIEEVIRSSRTQKSNSYEFKTCFSSERYAFA